jgi:DNA invertase Pin-like site-specific DNA recombinase
MRTDRKITSSHLKRSAYIYIRQSTEHQLRENIESRQRQYELVELAKRYNWTPNAIVVIDDDMGRSASSVSGRTGFARLVAEVALVRHR